MESKPKPTLDTSKDPTQGPFSNAASPKSPSPGPKTPTRKTPGKSSPSASRTSGSPRTPIQVASPVKVDSPLARTDDVADDVADDDALPQVYSFNSVWVLEDPDKDGTDALGSGTQVAASIAPVKVDDGTVAARTRSKSTSNNNNNNTGASGGSSPVKIGDSGAVKKGGSEPAKTGGSGVVTRRSSTRSTRSTRSNSTSSEANTPPASSDGTKAADGDDSVEGGDSKKKTSYWWRISPDATIPESKFKNPVFFPWAPFGGDQRLKNPPDMFISAQKWDNLRWLKSHTDDNPENWPQIKPPGERTFLARGRDGRGVQYLINDRIPTPPEFAQSKSKTDQSYCWVDFFDDQFSKGQELAQQIASAIDDPKWSMWTVVRGLPWEDRNKVAPGVFKSDGTDTREYISRTDGIGFQIKGYGGGIPLEDERYVKLQRGSSKASDLAATVLNSHDETAKNRGVNQNEMYISETMINQLKTGGYDFPGNGWCVPLRDKMGQIKFIRCEELDVQTKDFWNKAYMDGLTKAISWKPARSRNVPGLKLCFVVPTINNGHTTVEMLKAVVETAIANATVPIKHTAIVVSETDYDANLTQTYGQYISTSPFGDYKTYISKEDFAAYLASYEGYPLPNAATLAKIISTMEAMLKERAVSATRKDRAYTASLEKQSGDLSKTSIAQKPGVNVGQVNIYTIREAGIPGARSAVTNQQSMMGGSAATIASAALWQDYQDVNKRVPGLTTWKGTKWDGPGVYPCEWLHRSAFSWGNQGGNELSQATSNFIFGSSETNSVMTRYEKAWQLLFIKEREYQKAYQKAFPVQKGVRRSKKKTATYPDFNGILITTNTDPMIPIVDYSIDPLYKGNLSDPRAVKMASALPVALPTDGNGPNYSQAAIANTNLSWSLGYSLGLPHQSYLGIQEIPPTTFYPFQRGFFTRLEADVDFLLLEQLTKKKIDLIAASPGVANPNANTLPTRSVTADGLTTQPPTLSLNAMGGKAIDASKGKNAGGKDARAATMGSPLVVSPLPPSQLPHADVWRSVTSGNSVTVGGVTLNNASAASVSDAGQMMHIPLASTQSGDDASQSNQVTAAVAQASFASADLGSVPDNQAPTDSTVIDAPAEITNADDDNNIPKGFVLNGTVKLFDKFDEQIYVYYGSVATGTRQIIPIKPGSIKISDYISSLSGSDYEAIQLQNTQLVYNQLTTATDSAGTWIQTDLVFSGPLQPVSDFLANVCRQTTPTMRVQALLSPNNDWSKPVSPSGLGLRGILPTMSVKVGDLLEITKIGVSVALSRYTQQWPPYKDVWAHTIGMFGTMNIGLPQNMAPMSVDFCMVETQGVMTLIATVDDDESSGLGFAGIEGLKLSQLTMTTSLAVSKAPSIVNFSATAALDLRDTTFKLSGYYSKTDWQFYCDVQDFTFDDLRNMYEDLFGAQLHISDHDVVINDISFTAGPTGITLTGGVTVEGHTSAMATIVISRLGLHITGEVDNVPLEGDLALKSASLDIFIGRQDDTTVAGPGTSFQFAISGIIDVGSNEITASLYLDKDSGGKLLWTVIGSFSGALSIGHIVPALKGNPFFDLALQNAAFIASNVDGVAATGANIPAAYPVVKGIQIAATLGPIAALDSSLGNYNGPPTTGLTFQAMYSADTSAFELAIKLANPRSMSMKSGSVYSGPISLIIQIPSDPANTAIVINADFFVKVPNQADPLKFSGGLSLTPEEAKLYIELKDQWWNDPFGLSKSLRLGPNLALQIGISYPGPLYPSEIGIAAGLAIGSVTGSAALSISEDPTDELISLDVENLGIQDLVTFAETMLEKKLPMPDNFLFFKQFTFYLSTGTTIGTIIYPPGASFSCDAVIFGHEASVYVGVNKAQEQIEVKGSLQPIDIGPIQVSGYNPGTPARLDVQFGPQQQTILIDGGVKILDLDAKVLVNANILPSPTFSLQAELDFSTHLTFMLEADMRGGSFHQGTAGLKALDFDVNVTFHQDILDYIVTQVNTQVLMAKHAVDDGTDAAEHTLDQAQAEFKNSVDTAQVKVDAAKAAYDLKANQVNGALAAEQRSAELKTQELQAKVDGAVKAFNDAVESAQRNLQAAQDNRTKAIRAAQQKVNDAKAKGDKDIDNHLKQLESATVDMQRRFGDAINKVNAAQSNVDSLQRQVDEAQHEVDSAKRDLDHCQWYEKVPKSAAVTKAGLKLTGLLTGLGTARGVLNAAKGVIRGPGYAAAQASVEAYKKGVETARTTADDTLRAANGTLAETQHAQDALVAQVQSALTLARSSSAEKRVADAAKGALRDFQRAEAKVLAGLQAAVNALAQSAEAVAFGAANVGLKVAMANTKDVDVAKAAVEVAKESGDAVMDAGDWVVDHAVNILNLRTVTLSGDLRATCLSQASLKAHVEGTFAEQPVDFTVDFLPGKGEEMVKALFKRLMDDIKSGVMKIAKK